MDQAQSGKTQGDTMHVVIDEVRAPARRMGWGHPERWPGLLALGAILFGLAGFAFSGWVYVEGQREIVRLATEVAQLRVSLDLYMRSGTNTADLADLTERLTELEQAARSNAVPMPTAPANATDAAATPTPSGEDCLPEGMRLLVAAGDTYPICGQAAEVSVSFVDNGYITLSDGTSVASGGTTPLPGFPACTIAVTSGGDEGVTGYAEIRVNC